MIIKARNLSKKVIFNGEEINILDNIDLDISSNISPDKNSFNLCNVKLIL